MIKLNGHVIEPTIFPDGTSQVWQVDEHMLKPGHHCMPMQRVEWWFESEAELFHLKQLRMLMNGAGSLYMPYCPYARQDKDIKDDETFALIALFAILEPMNWSEIRTIDMHNPNAVGQRGYNFNWLNNKMTPDVSQYDTVIFPDAGAATRYDIKHDNIVIGNKVRDQQTGWITHYSFDGDVHGNAIVVDDLCDGGMTFELLGKSVQEWDAMHEGAYVKRLDLSVTHGVFSKGWNSLCNWYDTIFTTNSFFGHTLRSGTMLDDLEKIATCSDGYRNPTRQLLWYREMWKYVQQQRLVIQEV